MIELTVQWLLPDGRVGGRTADGTVVRLAGAVVGDTVRAAPTSRAGRTQDADLVEIVKHSPHRRPPTCPHREACGGCDLDTMAADARHEVLARCVARAFRVDDAPVVVPSPRASGYRARIKLAVEDGQLGYRARRSHTLVPVAACGIARPELQDALEGVRRWAHDDPARLEAFATLELRSDGSRAVHAFTTRKGRRPPPELDALGHVAVDGRAVAGDPTLTLQVDGVTLRASPRSFFQVNLEINEALVAWVRDRVLEAQPERVLDLYAGIGNLSLPLAARGVPVLAVEGEGQAVRDLQHAAAPWAHAEAEVARVERFDPSLHAFDVVVCDPPRAGAPGVLPRVVRNRPRRLVLVSCHAPATARDLRQIADAGYALTSIRCFDMFPDTHHIETVVVLERR